MKQYGLIICLMLAKCASAQYSSGAYITSLANAGVAIKNEWSLFKNQSGISDIQNIRVAVGYENKYFLKEFSVKSLLLIIPSKKYVLGLGFQSFGVNAYNESKSVFALTRKFGPNFSTSISIQYHQLQIANYGTSNAITFEVGSQFNAGEKFIIGAHIANPNNSRFNENVSLNLPAHLQFGITYFISDKVHLSSEFEHLLHKGSDVKLGLAYLIVNDIKLSGGLSQNPFQQFFGFGLVRDKFLIDISASNHPILGISPQISVGYAF